MTPNYSINYSFRKTIAIRITRDGTLRVSAPYGVPESLVHNFVNKKKQRILTKIAAIQSRTAEPEVTVDRQMKEQAIIQILPRVEYYASLMGLEHRYTDLKITTAQTKRGSCSSKGALMFHRKLSQFPLPILDYVIVHELAHLVHFNHSPRFWGLVEQHYPNYKDAKKRLKDNQHGVSIG